MAGNKTLRQADKNKNDEFYTQLSDIERELNHYREQFKDKVIFLNCDDPEYSNFWKYFELNFTVLGLKKLVATHYETEKPSYKLEIIKDENGDGLITSKDIIKTPLKQNGDFRSPECIEILKSADIIITNPPFSLFREYIAQLMEYNKKFIIIGNQNALSYKEIFPLIKDNKVWLGYNSGAQEFVVPHTFQQNNTYIGADGKKRAKFGNICWFTNCETKKRHETLLLYKTYNEEEYPKYDNYDAINVNKVKDIPIDYKGKMGVPITFIDKYNPQQFRILDGLHRYSLYDLCGTNEFIRERHLEATDVNGKSMYFRVVIESIEEE